jgi:hypothetical protein
MPSFFEMATLLSQRTDRGFKEFPWAGSEDRPFFGTSGGPGTKNGTQVRMKNKELTFPTLAVMSENMFISSRNIASRTCLRRLVLLIVGEVVNGPWVLRCYGTQKPVISDVNWCHCT